MVMDTPPLVDRSVGLEVLEAKELGLLYLEDHFDVGVEARRAWSEIGPGRCPEMEAMKTLVDDNGLYWVNNIT